MNLREDKGWSYGVRSQIAGAREQMPFFISAPVQTDRTGDALKELRRELTDYVGDRGITDEEASATTAFLSGRLPGRL